jgi:hypothetical protein
LCVSQSQQSSQISFCMVSEYYCSWITNSLSIKVLCTSRTLKPSRIQQQCWSNINISTWVSLVLVLGLRVHGAGSNEIEHSYWSRGSNWSQAFRRGFRTKTNQIVI